MSNDKDHNYDSDGMAFMFFVAVVVFGLFMATEYYGGSGWVEGFGWVLGAIGVLCAVIAICTIWHGFFLWTAVVFFVMWSDHPPSAEHWWVELLIAAGMGLAISLLVRSDEKQNLARKEPR